MLLLGETGTGKGLIARSIHNASRHSERPLIQVNCGALSRNQPGTGKRSGRRTVQKRSLVPPERLSHFCAAPEGAPGRHPVVHKLIRGQIRQWIGKKFKRVPQKTIKALQGYSWPENIRELENLIERAVITSPEGHLQIEIPASSGTSPGQMLSLEAVERDHILSVVGSHFWNPPYLIPLVEVGGGRETLAEVKDYTCNLLKSMGMHPVLVNKDVPGFIRVRLQHALWREAISIVENGIADPKTVDEVIKKGFGAQLPVQGPLENADLMGLDLTFRIQDILLKFMECSTSPSTYLNRKLQSGELGFKTRRGFYSWDNETFDKYRDVLIRHLVRWNHEGQSD